MLHCEIDHLNGLPPVTCLGSLASRSSCCQWGHRAASVCLKQGVRTHTQAPAGRTLAAPRALGPARCPPSVHALGPQCRGWGQAVELREAGYASVKCTRPRKTLEIGGHPNRQTALPGPLVAVQVLTDSMRNRKDKVPLPFKIPF